MLDSHQIKRAYIIFVSRLKAKRRELAKAGWFFDGRDVDERRSESVREQRNVIRRGARSVVVIVFFFNRAMI